MNKKKIIILGNLPLATKIIKYFKERNDIIIKGVVYPDIEKVYPNYENEICASLYCKKENIPKLSIDDVKIMDDLDLAVSCRNNDILKKWFLEKFKIGVVNCHGGYLPEYRGVGGHIFPIINREQYTGASLHWMSEEIDKGFLIDRIKIAIEKQDTGFSLFNKINKALFDLIIKNADDIIENKTNNIPQESLLLKTKGSYFYFIKDMNKLFSIKDPNDIISRAIYWPGK